MHNRTALGVATTAVPQQRDSLATDSVRRIAAAGKPRCMYVALARTYMHNRRRSSRCGARFSFMTAKS